MGELSAETLLLTRVEGANFDGVVHNTNSLLEVEIQTWNRGFTPCDIVSNWLLESWEKHITISYITINPGNYRIGDYDGLIFIPADIIEEVIEKSETAINTES